jgi:hypothetical protein
VIERAGGDQKNRRVTRANSGSRMAADQST